MKAIDDRHLLIGFLAGVAATWAALAIWQRVPPLGPIDPGDEPFPPMPAIDHAVHIDAGRPRRPGYRDPDVSAALNHDPECKAPRRPCVCSVFVKMNPGYGGL